MNYIDEQMFKIIASSYHNYNLPIVMASFTLGTISGVYLGYEDINTKFSYKSMNVGRVIKFGVSPIICAILSDKINYNYLKRYEEKNYNNSIFTPLIGLIITSTITIVASTALTRNIINVANHNKYKALH